LSSNADIPQAASFWPTTAIIVSWLSAFVRLLGACRAILAPDLQHHRVDVAPDGYVTRATRRHAAQMGGHCASYLVERSIGVGPEDQLALLFASAALSAAQS
jgi:hypothetical protein